MTIPSWLRRGQGERTGLRTAIMAGAGLAALLLGTYLVLAVLARPVADDYAFFGTVQRHGVLGTLVTEYQNATARWANQFFIAVGYCLFGLRAVQVAPAAYLVLLAVAAYLLTPCLLPHRAALSRPWRVFLALLATAVAIFTTPTVFDSYLWITSSVGYIGGTAFMLGSAAVFIRLMRKPGRIHPAAAAGAFVLFAFAQGFNEAHSLANCGLISLYLAFYALWRKRGHWVFLALTWVEAVALFAFMYFSPGTAKRSQSTLPDDPIMAGLRGIRSGYNEILDSFGRGDHFLILALAVLLAVLLVRRGLRVARRVALIGAGMAVIPAAAFLFTTSYATGWNAPRSYGSYSPMIAWGLACVVAAALAAAWRAPQLAAKRQRAHQPAQAGPGAPDAPPLPARRRPLGLRPLAAGLGLALLLVGAAGSMPNVIALAKAEAMRAQMMDFRDRVVRLGMKRGWSDIPVFPAPVLYDPSNATDFRYAVEQDFSWYEAAYRFIFKVPDDVTLTLVTEQPPGYCTDLHAHPIWNDETTKTCKQLARAWVDNR